MNHFPQKTKSTVTLIALVVSFASSSFAGIIHNESFDTAGTIGDYTGAGEVFSETVIPDNTQASVSGGSLNLQLLNTGGGTITTHTSLGSSSLELMSMEFDLRVNSWNAATDGFGLYIGAFNVIGDFASNWNPNEGARNWLKANAGASSNPYDVRAQDGTNTNHTAGGFALGTTYTWSVFLNDSGASESFVGADNNTYTLDNERWSLFVDGTLVADNVVKGTYGDSGSIDGVIFHVSKNHGGAAVDLSIDNIVIRDDLAVIPEPSTFLLVGLGLFGVLSARCFRRG